MEGGRGFGILGVITKVPDIVPSTVFQKEKTTTTTTTKKKTNHPICISNLSCNVLKFSSLCLNVG